MRAAQVIVQAVGLGKLCHGIECREVIGILRGGAQLHGLAQIADRRGEVAAAAVGDTDRLDQSGACIRLPVEFARHAATERIEHIVGRSVGTVRLDRVGRSECRQDDVRGLSGLLGLLFCIVARRSDALRLNRRADGQDDEGDRRCHDRREQRALAACKLRDYVGNAWRACNDRLVVEMPLHVEQQVVHGLVTPVWLLLQAAHDDPIEIPADFAARSLERLQPCRRSRRLLVANPPSQLLGARARQVAGVEGSTPVSSS